MSSIDTNTFLTYSEIGAREDLIDKIFNVSPIDTPLSSSISSTKATNRKHEWQKDVIPTVGTNFQLEGQTFVAESITPTTRLNNLCSISGHYVEVSDSTISQDHAGASNELDYQIVLHTKALKRDMEYSMLQNTAPATGNSSTAQTFAALPQWYVTNTVLGSGGANVTYTNSPGSARTDGTQAAITEANVKAVLQSIFSNSSEPIDMIMCGPYNKQQISGFAGPTGTYKVNQAADMELTAAFDVYRSDYGTHKVVPNRFQRERDLHFLNTDMLAVAYFRQFVIQPLAKTGDAERAQMLSEYTLEVRNETALGLYADLTT